MPLHPTKTCLDCGKPITYGATRCKSCANRISKRKIRPRGPLESRYRIDSDSGCWIWIAGKSTAGYGGLRIDGKDYLAHRFMYEKLVGPIPVGMSLDHLCRNPSCVNPEHLEPVTHQENVRRGAHTKLTPDQVQEIKNLPLSETQLSIAQRYGVSQNTIKSIREGRNWKDI